VVCLLHVLAVAAGSIHSIILILSAFFFLLLSFSLPLTSFPPIYTGLLQRQHEVIAQQNEALKDIEKGVGRLHEQAVDIGSEAKLHLHIISNLDTNVDAAADDLRAEAKHAETVRMKSRMCCLYLFLGMEVVLLVILLLVVFQYEGGFKPKGSNANGHSK